MKIHLKIKFRAFLITFANIDQTFDLAAMGFGLPSVGYHKFYDNRGILLEIS
ncbi:MAG: hypothetical protein J0H02_18800 [Armatimonadetes bacterium]|nr:hypothetical protein [Armatimonadota bacterium]